MSERETAEAIDVAAARWVARLDRLGEDAPARAELEAWLGGDVRRQGAYFRAQAAWAMLDRASALRGSEQAGEEQPPAGDRPSSDIIAPVAGSGWGEAIDRRAFVGRMAFAASLVAGAGGWLVWQARHQPIATAIGEIRRLPLQDGSMAAINTASRISVDMKPEIRRVELAQGEAWFQVAKDRARPFVVEAGDVRVRAVGTAFSVRRYANGTDVRVTEGVVEVWNVDDPAQVRRVEAGAWSFVADDAPPIAPVADGDGNERALAWRSGQLIFDGDTLEEAAQEFNRYNAVQVVIPDPDLAAEKLVGRFRTNEPEAFAQAAAGMLGVHAEMGGREIVLRRR